MFEYGPTAFCQRCAATCCAASASVERRRTYYRLDILEQKPSAPVAHAHRGRSGANGAGFVDQFEKARLARSEGCIPGKIYADRQACHVSKIARALVGRPVQNVVEGDRA